MCGELELAYSGHIDILEDAGGRRKRRTADATGNPGKEGARNSPVMLLAYFVANLFCVRGMHFTDQMGFIYWLTVLLGCHCQIIRHISIISRSRSLGGIYATVLLHKLMGTKLNHPAKPGGLSKSPYLRPPNGCASTLKSLKTTNLSRLEIYITSPSYLLINRTKK
eukprot:sb/3472457/